ncbi:hypothetical protein [Pseudomonas nitroreducens]|uniref:hypothetical protein n=1 Tax=Pseudomonas nitroreducens TaxID=46680 RepID=UPI002658C08F|nr:hypothetical protein [Pseudomonas nitroreducens]MCP1648253.1 hypothetical protein [Pseudomonas nitroreducens]MCP1686828.1 hypothetical protein [Pseudomonas nitroreducens]
MNFKVRGLPLLLAALLSLSAHAVQMPAQPAHEIKAYSGTDGVKVWLEQIGPRRANMYLLRVGGVDHAWNMRIHRMDGLSLLDESLFKLHSQREEPIALVLRGDCGEVMLPGERVGRRVCYDQALSTAQDPAQFVSAYLQQRR